MILVTGATGFLGAELIHQLTRKGEKVVALKREASVIPGLIRDNPQVRWVTTDINDTATLEEVFEEVTQVYHCAAMVSFHPRDKEEVLRVNIEGTSNIVNLCLEFNVRLLHVSSVAALGAAKKNQPITEKDFWVYDPDVSTYAISKYEGEMEVWRGMNEGLDAVIVNPSIILGSNAGTSGSGALFQLVRDGLSFYTEGVTGFVDVADVAAAMIGLMEHRDPSGEALTGERYILSAENHSFQEFFTLAATAMGVKPPMKKASKWMLELAWRAAGLVAALGGKAGLTKETARSSLHQNFYSNSKIKNTLNISFKPLNTSIHEICSATVRTGNKN